MDPFAKAKKVRRSKEIGSKPQKFGIWRQGCKVTPELLYKACVDPAKIVLVEPNLTQRNTE